MCTTTDLSCSSCCLILELRFLTTGRPVTVAARKLVAELGCRGMVIIVIMLDWLNSNIKFKFFYFCKQGCQETVFTILY